MNRSAQTRVRKGERVRPCHVCNEPVKFIYWDEESVLRKKKIFHWANADGTHHFHIKPEIDHIRSILLECYPLC